MKRRSGGFTLLELMIVVLVVAILTALAYPSYTRYLVKSRRAAGMAYLMDLAQREQQYFQDNRTYADTGTITGLVLPSTGVAADYTVTVVLDAVVATRPSKNFTISAAPNSGTLPATYQVTSDDTLTINEAGTKTPPELWQ